MMMLVDGAIEFIKMLQKKGQSSHTIRNYSIDLNCFKEWLESYRKIPQENRSAKIPYREVETFQDFGKEPTLLGLGKGEMRLYMGFLHEANPNRRTLLRRISSLRSFFRFLVKARKLEQDPMQALDNPKSEKSLPCFISYDQVLRLFEKPDRTSYIGLRDRTMMEVLYSSALRVSELVGLNRDDIDFQGHTLIIRGKGKKERMIPFTKSAANWLLEYLERSDRYVGSDEHRAQGDARAIFLNKHGTRITTRSVDRAFNKYLLACGFIEKVTPHTIRHTIATHWLEKGMDLKTIQALLGHSNLSTTSIYTHVGSKLKQKVFQESHPRA